MRLGAVVCIDGRLSMQFFAFISSFVHVSFYVSSVKNGKYRNSYLKRVKKKKRTTTKKNGKGIQNVVLFRKISSLNGAIVLRMLPIWHLFDFIFLRLFEMFESVRAMNLKQKNDWLEQQKMWQVTQYQFQQCINFSYTWNFSPPPSFWVNFFLFVK